MKLPKISDLTIDEKLTLLTGKDAWQTNDLNGKLPVVMVADGPCGVRQNVAINDFLLDNKPAIAYTATVTAANSWNRDVVRETGECIADDCIERDIDVILGPGVNIKRTPLCGRNFEYYSEDPYLAGELSAEYISGVQSSGVGTCLKHYCCNNMEYDRVFLSSEVDERTMREIYLPAFEIASKSKPWTVMCSYNLVNGRRMSEHKKLYDVLRKDLGFDGLIVSDWGAVTDPVASVKAGLSLIMPHDGGSFDALKKAYENGELTMEEIDFNIERLFELLEKNENAKKVRKVKRTKEERYAVAKKAEQEGIVLLKNEDGILPLKKGLKVAVSGHPTTEHLFGAGSAIVKPEIPVKSLANCLKVELGEDKVSFYDAPLFRGSHLGFNQQAWNTHDTIQAARQADVAVVCVGTGCFVEYEGGDREHCRLLKVYEDHILAVAEQNPNTVVVLYAGSYVNMRNWIDKVKAVVFAGFGGMNEHEAVAEVLTGKVNPSGKLSETFPFSETDVPSVAYDHQATTVRYIEGLDVGYRYFKTYNEPVMFPFGYGLSYTEFEYSNLKIEKNSKYDYTVSLSVTNIGDKDGAEVVQLYVRDPIAKVYRPYFELKGFDKKFIKAGETVNFTFTLDKRSFAYYSVSYDAWTVENGTFEIMVGASSEDIRLTEKIEIE